VTTRSAQVDEERETAVRVLEHEVGLLLRRVRRGIAERALQVHPELSATAYTILGTLAEFGPRRAADLAELFSMDKGTVSRVVHQLLELGLVERSPDPADGRASIIVVTRDATRRLARMHEQRRVVFAERLADWAAEDIAHLGAELGRFNQAVFQPGE
jgi:DNA-binding MarR family transcriptional regulator